MCMIYNCKQMKIAVVVLVHIYTEGISHTIAGITPRLLLWFTAAVRAFRDLTSRMRIGTRLKGLITLTRLLWRRCVWVWWRQAVTLVLLKIDDTVGHGAGRKEVASAARRRSPTTCETFADSNIITLLRDKWDATSCDCHYLRNLHVVLYTRV